MTPMQRRCPSRSLASLSVLLLLSACSGSEPSTPHPAPDNDLTASTGSSTTSATTNSGAATGTSTLGGGGDGGTAGQGPTNPGAGGAVVTSSADGGSSVGGTTSAGAGTASGSSDFTNAVSSTTEGLGTASNSTGAASSTGGAGGSTSSGSTTGSAETTGTTGFPPLTENVTIHVAGDSTAAIFPASDPTGRVGWAAVLQQFFGEGVEVDDAARSGRSSKSFIDEGFWDALEATIQTGDYVFIQFGHNDEKSDDPARYTDPATTYRSYLKTYIADTRSAGGFAVLLTPISRRQFSGGQLVPTHGDYPAAMLAVGEETGTPVIDMTEKTRVLLESLGPTNTIPLFATDDNTHLSATGAPEVAKLAVEGIRELGFPLAERLVP